MRKRRKHEFGEVCFRGGGCAEAGAVAQSRTEGFDQHGSSMAENQGPPGADVVNVVVAIGVEDVRAMAAPYEGRISANRAKSTHRRVDAARDHHFGAFLQLARLFELARHATSWEGSPHYNSGRESTTEAVITRSCDQQHRRA